MRPRTVWAAAALLAAGITSGLTAPPSASTAGASYAAPQAAGKTATTTTAFVQDGFIAGRVTAAGKGVKGLKVRIQRKAGSGWENFITVATQKGGGYSSQLVRVGTYRAVTQGNASYKGSTSKPVTT
jgi:hypothetical protein